MRDKIMRIKIFSTGVYSALHGLYTLNLLSTPMKFVHMYSIRYSCCKWINVFSLQVMLLDG